jgi:ubiquitin
MHAFVVQSMQITLHASFTWGMTSKIFKSCYKMYLQFCVACTCRVDK